MNIPQMPAQMVLRHSCMERPNMVLEDDQRRADYSTLGERIPECAMRLLTVIAISLLFAPVTSAHVYCPKAECEKTKQKIQKIRSKMRQGYTAKQGEKMEADLRKLRAIRSKQCR